MSAVGRGSCCRPCSAALSLERGLLDMTGAMDRSHVAVVIRSALSERDTMVDLIRGGETTVVASSFVAAHDALGAFLLSAAADRAFAALARSPRLRGMGRARHQ